MSERETVKEEVARLQREVNDAEWGVPKLPPSANAGPVMMHIQAMQRRIDYLTREYIARGIIYEPEH